MAGTYADYPSNRIAWDIDGTKLYSIAGSTPTLQADSMAILNDEDATTTVSSTLQWALVFPSRRLIDSIMIYTDGGGTTDLEYSEDSTNGVNGTWAPIGTIQNGTTYENPAYRNAIRPILQGCRAIRLSSIGGAALSMVHLFGDFDYSTNMYSLAIWHPTEDARVEAGYFDFGSVIRGSSEDIDFRVMNLSRSLIAVNVSVYLDALTVADPPQDMQHLLSADEGDTFLSREYIGDLAPTTVSGIVTLRRNTVRAAALGPWVTRLRASASAWEPIGT